MGDARMAIGTPQQNAQLVDELALAFRVRFGAEPRLFRAPGRVNLIGEHTDYNDGFVMPAAIDFHTWLAVSPRADRTLVVHSIDFSEEREFGLDDPALKRERSWTDYVVGVALALEKSGHRLTGANVMIRGNVPIGAGVSSSASIEVAVGFALMSLAGMEVDRVALAKLTQRAENEFVGTRCGIMDQFISANAQGANALLLDCRTLEFHVVPVPEQVELVICNTMVKHELSTGEYNVRRAECEEGVRLLRTRLPEIKALRDVTLGELERNRELLPEVVYRRCRHVVSENARVLAAGIALRSSDLLEAGRLMYDSHQSLRNDYEVSCAELDAMVEAARAAPGIVGARMTGGGFGGCTVNLVKRESVEQFRTAVSRQYSRATGIEPEIYVSRAAGGASEVRPQDSVLRRTG